MRRIQILKSSHYSVDGKLLWLDEGQEVFLPELYAGALVLTGSAKHLGIVEETESEPEPEVEEKPKTKAKKAT